MEWFKKNYDKVILLLAALVTGGLAVSFIVKALKFGENFTVPAIVQKGELPRNPQEDVVVATETLGLKSYWVPPNLGGKRPALFLSVPIVEKGGEIYNMNEEERKLREPVANGWLVKYGLEFLRAGVLDLDPDKDGFSNLEEWEGKSDPKNAKDHPSFLMKLVLAQRKQQNYFLEFKANNAPDFQVERVLHTGKRQTWFKKLKGKFGGDRFLIESFEEKEAEAGGITRDVSELGIKDLEKDTDLTLVLRQRVNLPTYFAEFRYDVGEPVTFTVKVGEVFTLPSGDSKEYKLVDVQPDKAIIEDVPPEGSGKEPEQMTVPQAGS